ncbi:MAG: MarR family winged helix-turn-helix transcriptional regulator [Actinomycetota bacterium]|nr:MarR family winged helix-turn-helix transcriptional regulator [Actinomycetota bacterium]
MPDPAPGYRHELIVALTRILAEWTAPDFLTAVAAREGVSLDPGAIVMVTILSRQGASRPSRLAAQMVTGASNVSKIVGRLTEAGLAVRGPDPSEARVQPVHLT